MPPVAHYPTPPAPPQLVPEVLALIALFTETEKQLYAAVAQHPGNDTASLHAAQAVLHDCTAAFSRQLHPALLAQYAAGIRMAGIDRAVDPRDAVRVSHFVKELEANLLAGLLTVQQTLPVAMRKAQTAARTTEPDEETGKPPTAHQLLLAGLITTGFVAYEDTLKRPWGLSRYATMATYGAAQTAANAGALFADLEQDLYIITSSAHPCAICAPLEGRIFSRSGLAAEFPGLVDIFTDIIDAYGDADDLDNRWLGLHANCQHYISRISESDHTEEEWNALIVHSSLTENPVTHDPRSDAQLAAYRQQTRSRMLAVAAYKKTLAKQYNVEDIPVPGDEP